MKDKFQLDIIARARRWLPLLLLPLLAAGLFWLINGVLAATETEQVLSAGSMDLALGVDAAPLSRPDPADPFITARAEDILGGERDVWADAAGLTVQWDGTDGDPTSLDHTGLGGLDLTGGGLRTAFTLEVAQLDRPVDLTLTAYTSERSASVLTSTLERAGRVSLPFADFVATQGNGADFRNLGALTLEVDGSAALQLGALATHSPATVTVTELLIRDVNRNGRAEVGDAVAYRLEINNQGQETLPAVVLSRHVAPTQGQILGAESSQGHVSVQAASIIAALGDLPAGAAATFSYPVRLRQGPTLMVDLVLQDGDTPPGGGGNPVTSLNAPFTNGNGQVGFTGAVDNAGSNDNFVWYDTGIVHLNSSIVSPTLTGGEGTMGVSDTGGFNFSPSVDGGDAVWSQNGLLAVEGTQAPGFPAGTTSTFHSRPHMYPAGQAYWVAGFNETGGTSSEGRMLYTSADALPGSTAVVIRSDDLVDGLAIDRPSGVGFDYQISANGSHHLHDLLMDTGGTTDDGAVYFNGSLVARESFPSGNGDNWDNFDVMTVNNSGNYIFSGDTDGDTASDEFIAYNNAIVLREGDLVDGFTLGSSVGAASINELGEAAFIWSVTGNASEALFYACDAAQLGGATVLLTDGVMVDVTGDGVPDATVTDFNASNIIGPGLWLATNGLVYVEVDLDYGNGDLEAIIGLETPCAGEPTPTPTSTATGTAPTPTSTPTSTATNTPTNTPTMTNTPEPPTNTPTSTPEPPTETPTSTAEPPTSTPTNTVEPPTNTPTATNTPTSTPTGTPVVTDVDITGLSGEGGGLSIWLVAGGLLLGLAGLGYLVQKRRTER